MTLRDDTDAAVATLSVLADEVRRNLYFQVRSAGSPITRDQAAELTGISRNLAAFHLEKLVAAGLLSVSQSLPPRLRRPGRVPKLYGMADAGIEVSLPPRRYRTMAAVFVESVRQGGEAIREVALGAAASCGRQIGAAALDGARVGRLGLERALGLIRPLLEDNGYEPEVRRTDGVEVLMRNCPFHGLLETDRALVCALNRELVGGMLTGLGAEVLEAKLIPRAEHCCVTVVARGRDTDSVPADECAQKTGSRHR